VKSVVEDPDDLPQKAQKAQKLQSSSCACGLGGILDTPGIAQIPDFVPFEPFVAKLPWPQPRVEISPEPLPNCPA
jgi:hypothetical protein